MRKGSKAICCGAVTAFCGLVVLLTGVLVGTFIHNAIGTGIEDSVVLTREDQSANNDEWKGYMTGGKDVSAKKSSLLLYYVFNVTNPAAVIAGARPRVQEVGPYCSYTNQLRTDVSFSADGTVLSSAAASSLIPVSAAECKAHMARVGGRQAEPRDASQDVVTVVNPHFIGAIQTAGGPTALAASVGNQVWSTIKSSLLGAFIDSVRGSATPRAMRGVFGGQRQLQFASLLGAIAQAVGTATFGGTLATNNNIDCTAAYNFPGVNTCPLGINTAAGAGTCDVSNTFAANFADATKPGSIFNSNAAQGYGLWLQAASFLSKAGAPATRTATETAAFNGLVAIVKNWTPCTSGGTTDAEAQQAIGRVVTWMSGTWWPSSVTWKFVTDKWRTTTTNNTLSCDGSQYCDLEVLPFIKAINPAATVSANVAAAMLPEDLSKSQTLSLLNDTLPTTGFKLWQGAGAFCGMNPAYGSCEYISSTTKRADATAAYNALANGFMTLDGITPSSATAAQQATYKSIVCGVASWLGHWSKGTTFLNGQLASQFNTQFSAHNISLNATDLSDLGYLQFATGAVTQQLLGQPSLASVPNSGVTSPPEFSAMTAALTQGAAPTLLTAAQGRALLDALAGSATNVGLILTLAYVNADGSYNPAKAATFNVQTPAWAHPLEQPMTAGSPVKLGTVLGGATQSLVQRGALQGQGFVCSYASLKAGACDYKTGGFFITERADRVMFEKFSDPFVFNVIKSQVQARGVTMDCAGGPRFQDACPAYGRGSPLPDFNCAATGLQATVGGNTLTYQRDSTQFVTRADFYSSTLSTLSNSPNPMFAVYPGRFWDDAAWQKQYLCSSAGPGKRWNECLTRVRTGKGDIAKVGTVVAYLGNTTVDIFQPTPVPMSGFEGTQFPPAGREGLSDDYSPPDKYTIWVSQGARSLDVVKTKETSMDDVKLFRYEITEAGFEKALSKGTGGVDVNSPKGLVNATPLLGAPAFLGPPHFVFNRAWGGSEYKYIEGLRSEAFTDYETFVDIEPALGRAFRGAQRLQVAFKVDRSVLAPDLGKNTAAGSDPAVSSLYIPLFWGQQSGVAREQDTKDFKDTLVAADNLGTALILVGLIVGILLMVVGCFGIGSGMKINRSDPASNVAAAEDKHA